MKTPADIICDVLRSARIQSEFASVEELAEAILAAFAYADMRVDRHAAFGSGRSATPAGPLERLQYSVDLYRNGNLIEVLARCQSLAMAQAAFTAGVAAMPGEEIVLRQGGRVVMRA